ncbi:MAG: YdbL family protein [Desulfococcaceae bacterium]
MKQHGILLFGSVLLVGLLFLSGPAGARDIKARMKDRLPIINELKAKGIVGENNQGFLEFVGGQQEKPEVVKAENEDRAVVYAAIAKQQGVSAELVGKRRAAQLRELAKPGEWLQNESGEWYKK